MNGTATKPPLTGGLTASPSTKAAKAIGDPFAIAWIDDREAYGEERINLLGMCENVVLHVTYTERGERIRIISVRRVERHEQDRYYRENSA